MADRMSFADDVVIVTGAGRGLGREYALQFAERGAKVLVNDYSPNGDDVASQVVAEIVAAGGQAVADGNSVATAEGARAIVDAAVKAFGTVTILVNNAGIISFGKIDEVDQRTYDAMQDVTLAGCWHMCQAIWPVFRALDYGRIVNTTSNVGFAGVDMLPHYGAAKAGVQGLTKCLAQSSRDHGISVNAIAPMAVTRMNRDMFFDGVESANPDWQADIRTRVTPMGPPVAVAPTVLWLSHRSTDINGEIFSTSSGKVARVAFVVGEGYFNPDHGPEDLRDNAERIRTLGDFLDPAGAPDEIALIAPLFGA